MANGKIDKALQQLLAMWQALKAAISQKAEIKLLWQNASPGSSFAAQTIKLGLSGYNYVDITVRANNDKASEYTTRLKVDGGATDIGAMGSTGLYRPATPTQAGVAFLVGRAYTAYNTSNTVQSNNYCVPVKIYGIKGAV